MRMDVFDVLVGINLLREGLDIPEVSLVAILDADKQGFLRTETSLVQTIGRAARNAEGRVIMYADSISPAMQFALDETARRREIQQAYNEKHGIIPQTIKKSVRAVIEATKAVDQELTDKKPVEMTKNELKKFCKELEKSMKEAAANMEFERAALLRDQLFEYRAKL